MRSRSRERRGQILLQCCTHCEHHSNGVPITMWAHHRLACGICIREHTHSIAPPFPNPAKMSSFKGQFTGRETIEQDEANALGSVKALTLSSKSLVKNTSFGTFTV
mmetsp:Transcript_99183/g.159915  ORF Transcript_99183/g.159915 Transcript_99183/m.159915 type:complete len:106 (+) Transcript_99183:169-486(+)